MAVKIGVKERTIQAYLRKENFPNAQFLSLLQEKCSVNLNWYLNGEGAAYIENQDSAPFEKILRYEYNLTEKDIALILNTIEFLSKKNG